MNMLNLTKLIPTVATKMGPFCEELLGAHEPNVHSIHIVGSAVTADYNEKLSDINSVVVLREMSLDFIKFLAPLGKRYGKKGIAAPLVMTPEYVQNSLDAFPLEFFDFKLIHTTVFGNDILVDLRIAKQHLRLQCERELKSKLIGLRQGFIASLGKKDLLAAALVKSFTGSMPLFRAVIHLLDKKPPIPRMDVIQTLGTATNTDTAILAQLLALKTGRIKPSEQELHEMFKHYYAATESMGKIIDELHA